MILLLPVLLYLEMPLPTLFGEGSLGGRMPDGGAGRWSLRVEAGELYCNTHVTSWHRVPPLLCGSP